MSAAVLSATRSQVPAQHHAAFDAEMAKAPNAAAQAGAGTFIQALIALLKAIGANVNWACVISVIPQAIAAFANPALWIGVIAAYFACAGTPIPSPAPTPTP